MNASIFGVLNVDDDPTQLTAIKQHTERCQNPTELGTRLVGSITYH